MDLTRDRIRAILDRIPKSNPVYDPDGIGVPDARLYWKLLNAPDFGHRVASAYAFSGNELPHDICETWIRRLYTTLRYPDTPDNVAWQLTGVADNHSVQMAIMKAMLISPDRSITSVAEFLRLPEEFVQGYHDLFFNVRPRLEETLFISELLYPHGRAQEFNRDYLSSADWTQILLRCAFHNDFEDFYYLIGARKLPKEHSLEDAVSQVEQMIMNNAIVAGTHLGGMQQRGNVGFNNAKALISSAKIGGGAQAAAEEDILLGGEDTARRIKDELFNL